MTFTVDAVWAGNAGKTITLYQWSGVSEGITVKVGTRYLIFAEPIRFGFAKPIQDPGALLQLDGCSCQTYERAEELGWIRDLGPSRPPQ